MSEKQQEENPQQPQVDPQKESQDQILRMKADFENSKKRFEREKMDAIKYANEKLLAEILPIMDNLDRAMASLNEGHDVAKIAQGMKLAQTELHGVLEAHGVTTVKGIGEDFDPQFHEAVGFVEESGLEDGKVAQEVQRGYLLNGRLIRPSRVRIVKK